MRIDQKKEGVTIIEVTPGSLADATGLKVGDRITWTIMDNCGKCYYCREKGLMMKCLDLKKYGHDSCAAPPHFLGGFAEYCYVMPGTCIIKVPDGLSDEVVASANCALATVVAGWEAAQLQPGDNVLIQGAGTLGIYAGESPLQLRPAPGAPAPALIPRLARRPARLRRERPGRLPDPASARVPVHPSRRVLVRHGVVAREIGVAVADLVITPRITIPASDGPTINAMWKMVRFMLSAPGSSSAGTRRGTSA